MAEVGDRNPNGQYLLAKTNKSGTDHNAKLWIVRCMRPIGDDVCDHVYGVNGTDFHERRCPQCMGGMPGLPLP
jgi:hypothetical protein